MKTIFLSLSPKLRHFIRIYSRVVGNNFCVFPLKIENPFRVSRIYPRDSLGQFVASWVEDFNWHRSPERRRGSLPAWWKVCQLFSGVGVYISRVEEGSVAERAGLRPGDTILEVNGTPFRAVTHEEALKVSLWFLLHRHPFQSTLWFTYLSSPLHRYLLILTISLMLVVFETSVNSKRYEWEDEESSWSIIIFYNSIFSSLAYSINLLYPL